MRFPIDVLLLDRRGEIVAVRRNVRPWRLVLPVSRSYATLELPVGSDLEVGIRLQLDPAGQECPRSLTFLRSPLELRATP